MPAFREAVSMPGGGTRYMNSMTRPDLLAVARIQKQDAPAVVTHSEPAEDGKTTGAGLPVDELTQMISQLKVKKPRNKVSGTGVIPKGRRVAFV